MSDLSTEVARVLAERRAALDEEEHLAEKATPGPWEFHLGSRDAWIAACNDGTQVAVGIFDCDAPHIAHNAPAHVLASVVERRAIYDAIGQLVEMHKPELSNPRWPNDPPDCSSCRAPNGDRWEGWFPAEWPCPTIVAAARALGLGSTGEQGNENG